MKFKTILIAVALISISAMGCGKDSNSGAGNAPTLKTFEDSVSYAMGWMFGRQVAFDSTKIDLDNYSAGFREGKDSSFKSMKQEVMSELLNRFQAKMQAANAEKGKKQQEELMMQGEKNKELGPKFLEENKKKANVKTTASGLQYIILKDGTGKTPELDDIVTIKFVATMIDGKEFDSKDNLQVPVKAFKGWTEAMMLSKVGGHYKYFFPPEIAFGDKPMGAIAPNSVVIFDVEILKTDKSPAMPPQGQGQPPRMR